MSQVCLPGLQGFPVQVSGWNNLTTKSQIITPNDIHLQFSPSETPMRYFPENGGSFSINGTNSFFISGNQHDVFSVRLTKPNQEGLQSFSGNIVAEFQIWGQKKSSENEFAVLIVPIYFKPIESFSGVSILRAIRGESSRLIDCIPGPQNSKASLDQLAEIVRYKTCVENDSQTIPIIFIDVAYWSTGTFVRQSDFSQIIPQLAEPGFPIRRGIRLLTSFTQLVDENLTKSDRKYEVVSNNSTSLPYKKSVSLLASSKEFQNAFRVIKDFTKQKEDSEQKYIPINLETDIKDGMLLVDLSTGKRLSPSEVQQNIKTEQNININTPEVEIQIENANYGLVLFLKIVGVLIGLGIILLILRFFQKFASSPNTSTILHAPIENISSS
jgi:hypothetical protein